MLGIVGEWWGKSQYQQLVWTCAIFTQCGCIPGAT